jgi:hypothetical protein
MSYTTINKSSDFFNTKLFTGNGGTQSISSVGFQPDWVWLKSRSVADSPILFDAVRGVTKRLMSNSTGAETTEAQEVQSFDSDGFTVGNSDNANRNNATMVAWNWKANGAGSSNTDGSITSTVSVNATSGFSIVKFTGTGSLATVGHGLGSAPKMIIMKNTNTTNGWEVYHQSLGNTDYIQLNTTDISYSSATRWNNTSPTNNVFTVNTENGVNKSGSDLIAYCFAEKTGYSKFGKYTGNGSTDGAFVYTGFKPAFVIIKNTSATEHWNMNDNKRDPFNVMSKRLYPSSANNEVTDASYYMDYLSNGFKIRSNSSSWNSSGNTMIYMAFAEAPLVGSNNVPCTAR